MLAISCDAPREEQSAGYTSSFNPRTADIARTLGGDWQTQQGADLHLKFTGPVQSMSVDFSGEVKTHSLRELQVECNADSVCKGKLDGQIAIVLEIVDEKFFYLIYLPEKPLSVSDYESGKGNELPMLGTLFARPDAPRGVLM